MSAGAIHHICNNFTTNLTAPGTGALTGALTSDFSCLMAIPTGHDRITLMTMQVARTFYNVDEANCTFTVKWNSGTTSNFSLSTKIGNYSSATMKTALNLAGNWSNGAPGTWDISALTNVLTLTLTANTFAGASDGISGLNNRMARLLGFTQTTATATVYKSGSSTTLVAPYEVNFSFSDALYVCCSIAQEATASFVGNCVARVLSNAVSFRAYEIYNVITLKEHSRRLLTYEEGNPAMRSAVIYRVVNFRLVDETGTPVNVRGGDIDFTFLTYAEEHPYALLQQTARTFLQLAQEQRLVNAAQLTALKQIAATEGQIAQLLQQMLAAARESSPI